MAPWTHGILIEKGRREKWHLIIINNHIPEMMENGGTTTENKKKKFWILWIWIKLLRLTTLSLSHTHTTYISRHWAANNNRFMSKFELVFDPIATYSEKKEELDSEIWFFSRCARKQHSKNGFVLWLLFLFLFLLESADSLFRTIFLVFRCCCCWCRATCRNLSMEWIIVCLCYLKIAGILSKRNKSKQALLVVSYHRFARKKKIANIYSPIANISHIRFGPFQHRSLAHKHTVHIRGNLCIEHLNKR